MVKDITIRINIDSARHILTTFGILNVSKMSDDEVFERYLRQYLDFRTVPQVKYTENPLPNMRSKVEEYIKELDKEIDRCDKLTEVTEGFLNQSLALVQASRAQTLIDVKNDLQSRLEDLI